MTESYFSNPSAAQIKAIDDMVDETALDVFSSSYNSIVIRQSPPVAQKWVNITPLNPITFNNASDGSENSFSISRMYGHIQEIISDCLINISAGATGASPCPLAPYYLFKQFKVQHGDTILISYLDPIYMWAWYFERLTNELRNYLWSLSADQTVNAPGTVHQILIWPMWFSELLSGITRPPIPAGILTTPLQIFFTPRAINKWTANSTVATTAVLTMQTWVKLVMYAPIPSAIGNDTYIPPKHSDAYSCAFELPVYSTNSVSAITATVQSTVNIYTTTAKMVKGIWFQFQSAANAAATVNNYLQGRCPDLFHYNPLGNSGDGYGLGTKPLIKVFMQSQWLEQQFFNATTTTSTFSANTWESNLFYSFGPKYDVKNILSLYKFPGAAADLSTMDVTYDTTGTLTVLPISIQLIWLNLQTNSFEFAPGTLH